MDTKPTATRATGSSQIDTRSKNFRIKPMACGAIPQVPIKKKAPEVETRVAFESREDDEIKLDDVVQGYREEREHDNSDREADTDTARDAHVLFARHVWGLGAGT